MVPFGAHGPDLFPRWPALFAIRFSGPLRGHPLVAIWLILGALWVPFEPFRDPFGLHFGRFGNLFGSFLYISESIWVPFDLRAIKDSPLKCQVPKHGYLHSFVDAKFVSLSLHLIFETNVVSYCRTVRVVLKHTLLNTLQAHLRNHCNTDIQDTLQTPDYALWNVIGPTLD